MQTCCTPFTILNQLVIPCKSLSVAYELAYKFLRRQVRWSGIFISLRLSHSLLWSTPWKSTIHYNEYFLRNLYAGQEATVRTGHGPKDWFKWEKKYVKAVYCHPACLTYMQSTSWETLGWKNHKLESRLLGEISITSDMQMTPPLWQKMKN